MAGNTGPYANYLIGKHRTSLRPARFLAPLNDKARFKLNQALSKGSDNCQLSII